MAVANRLSTQITNADAGALTDAKSIGQRIKESVATVEMAVADDQYSVYRFVRVHSADRVSRVEFGTDALGGGSACTIDIGVAKIASAGGALVVTQAFASSLACSEATAMTDVTYEATAADISYIEKALWERLGLSADPKCDYDIVAYATTNPAAAGTMSMKVQIAQ